MQIVEIKTAKGSIRAKVARSVFEKMRGLAGTRFVAPDEGMLFVFNMDARWGITMSGMLFGLDVLWVDANGFVVDIIEKAQPVGFPMSILMPTMKPKAPARYVLELCMLQASVHDIKVGSHLFDPEILKAKT